jgi:hypothetical protein
MAAVRILCAMAYVLLLLPLWGLRRATGGSRFGRRFHRGASAWDLPAGRSGSAGLARPQAEGARHGRA